MAPSRKKKPLTDTLIQLIESHPAIWNKTSKDYKDVVIRSNAWVDVRDNLKASFEVEELVATKLNSLKGIKAHWKNLQHTYSNKKKKSKGTSGAGLDQVLEAREWEFFDALRFLDQSGKFGTAIKSSTSRVDLFFGDESSEEDLDLDEEAGGVDQIGEEDLDRDGDDLELGHDTEDGEEASEPEDQVVQPDHSETPPSRPAGESEVLDPRGIKLL